MELEETFKEEFDQKLEQLKRFTNHGPSLGRYVEILLLNLLKKYLPQKYAFNSGFIYALNPSLDQPVSPQLDIICHDRINFPVFFDENEIVVLSPKAVKCIIEVKSTLTADSLNQILNTIRSEPLKEVPLSAKAFLVATKSNISPKAVFNKLKSELIKKKGEKIEENMFFGCIFSLDWDEMITFRTTIHDDRVEYDCNRVVISDTGIAAFILNLLHTVYGNEVFESINNVLAPSLCLLEDTFSMTLFFGESK